MKRCFAYRPIERIAVKHLRFEKPYFVEYYKDATAEFEKSLRKWDAKSLCKMPYLFNFLYMDPDCEVDLKKTLISIG